jgi:ATP-dependent DNA ligase
VRHRPYGTTLPDAVRRDHLQAGQHAVSQRPWWRLGQGICTGREELIVLGWTPPAGSRVGIGAVHVGYYDPAGQLYYAGGVGSGFDDKGLQAFRERLNGMQTAAPPEGMLVSGDPVDVSITWVPPEIVIEVQYTLRGQLLGP